MEDLRIFFYVDDFGCHCRTKQAGGDTNFQRDLLGVGDPRCHTQTKRAGCDRSNFGCHNRTGVTSISG